MVHSRARHLRHATTRLAVMNQIPDVLYADRDSTTWLILGASRGIGLEFVRQLLQRDERIIATVREPYAAHASALWGQAGSDHGRCQMYNCDVLSEDSIVVRLLCRTARFPSAATACLLLFVFLWWLPVCLPQS